MFSSYEYDLPWFISLSLSLHPSLSRSLILSRSASHGLVTRNTLDKDRQTNYLGHASAES